MFLITSTTVASLDSPTRLSDFIFQHFSAYIPSRKGVKKQLKKGAIYLNDKVAKSGDWLCLGDKLSYYDLEENPPKPYPLTLEIVLEDDYFAVINKPAGISVSGNEYRTIQNSIIDQIIPPNFSDKLQWARPVHRLDNATSGLLLIAKTKTALIELGKAFEKKEIQKTYVAVVIGKLPESGAIETLINQQVACSKFKRLAVIPSLTNQYLSLVELYPKTGRTHQLRIHLQSIGYPIMGDKLYGTIGQHIKGKGLFLCAKRLVFQHPISKEKQCIEIEIPHKFTAFLKNEEERCKRFSTSVISEN